MTRTYLVIFEKTSDAWSAFAPDVPNTGGLGDTVDEARKSLSEGIGFALEYALEMSLPFPDAKSTTIDFSEFDPNPAQSHYEVEWLTVDLPEVNTHSDNLAQQAA